MSKDFKGVVLAGGKGTRFYPLTSAVNKHLLPLYDKPMVYAPISMLMLMGIREIVIVTNPHDVESFKRLLGNGERFGTSIEYAVQDTPGGLPDALLQAEPFLDGSPSAVILGDNILHGRGLSSLLQSALQHKGATVFAYEVEDPRDFGVITFDGQGRVLDLVEKPTEPKSNWAAIGIYTFDSRAVEFAKDLRRGPRDETEIVDLLKKYMDENTLNDVRVPRGITWLDMGTPENLLQGSEYLRLIDKRQKLKVAVLEEIAWRSGWLSLSELIQAAEYYGNSSYGDYLSYLASSL